MSDDNRKGGNHPSRDKDHRDEAGLEHFNEGFNKQDRAGRISSFDRPAPPKPKRD